MNTTSSTPETLSPLRIAGAIIAAILVAYVAAGCTKADLVPIEHEHLYERQHIVAEVCAPAPTAASLPYKILFVIDTSLSNAWNDPAGLREQAVRGAITSLIDEETVSFGIITFSDEPRRQTFGFTRDLEILDGATENVSNAQGGTNYSDTLWTVIDFINDDISTLTDLEAARTHYVVFWLSDGFPTVGVTDTTALAPSVSYLTNLASSRVAEIQFNTAFLGAGGETNAAEVTAATALLETLAEEGDGAFSSIPAGEDFEFVIEREQVIDHFELAYVVASNRNTRLLGGRPWADSDGDGIADADELAYGLDPTLADSDGDGYRDGVELRSQGAIDPLIADQGCASGDSDKDLDGLRDCEELIAGTLMHNPDSDGDRVLDGVELLHGTSPRLDDADDDDDLDHLSNLDELRSHLDPEIPNLEEEVTEWSYRYEVRSAPRTCQDCFAQPPCYTLRIDNLTMTETLETAEHPAGGNVIDVMVAFRGSAVTAYRRAELRGRVLVEPDLWDPPGGRFELTTEDFGEVMFSLNRR